MQMRIEYAISHCTAAKDATWRISMMNGSSMADVSDGSAIRSKVSIIIPVYNCQEYIRKCLESVLQQTYGNIEIIVIDDGSEDDSSGIIDQVLKEKKEAKVFHQKNQGVSMARNYGLKNATGEYIAFLDGDDYLGTRYIEELVAAAEKNTSELVICGYQKVDPSGTLLEKVVPGQYIPYEHEEWACRICSAGARLYKKELWDKYDIAFEPDVRGEDVPIALFFNKISRNITTVASAEYYYVQHGKSMMHNFRGLRNVKLPYRSIEEMLNKAEQFPGGNSREFLELGVMRLLTQCIFDFGRGAEKKQLHDLCDFAEMIMWRHFPQFWGNRKSSIWSDLDIPFINKLEVKIFMILLKGHMLYPAASMIGMM